LLIESLIANGSIQSPNHTIAIRCIYLAVRLILLSSALLLFPFAERGSEVPGLQGSEVLDVRADPGTPELQNLGTAFVFTTTDCPIANRYAPEITRLSSAFSSRGIEFRLVYVNPRERDETTRAHARRFGYTMPALHDRDHALVKKLGITVTPEVAIVAQSGELLYRGRIDDRYTDIGVDRQTPTRRDFEDALAAVVAGRPVAAKTTRAVGCIVADLQPVTFVQDVAPVLFEKCASCHRADGSAPFALTTYREARQRASLIASVTERRFMPPYYAESDAGTFVGQKRLTDAEISLLRRWVDDGALEGEPTSRLSAPRFPEGWHLGTPDLVVTTTEPYILPAAASDVFRIFVIRLPVTLTKYVTGIEFQPGNARVVHHANIRLDRTAASRELDSRDPLPGYDGLLARSASYPEGHFLGWTPGQVAPVVSPDLAWPLGPGTDLVVQLHMQPSGAPELVQPRIGFFFSDTPPARTPTILRLGSQGIDIAPGDARYVVKDSYVLPVDVELHAVQPHAHYRLREARGTATLPDGTTRSLIRIDNWDFRWQHVYRYDRPIPLPKGTRVAMEYRYDNSADNVRNPQLPAERVFWGQRSLDEMGDLWFQFVTTNAADRTRLSDEILGKMTAEDIVGYETMLRVNPRDAELHDDAALLYLSLGQGDSAVRHFKATVDLKPSASAHFNLGTALTVARRLDDAVKAFRESLRLNPDYAAAHNNLGSVLAAQGNVADAIGHFRAATKADPANVQAHRNLAWHIANQPGSSKELLTEAIAAAEKAVTLTDGRDPNVLDALAIAYRASGLTDKASAVAERARQLRQSAKTP
jgi:tetratricopeptide (TPR) repeat protein